MTAFWGVLAALGALAFVTASDWPRAWSMYLVNLVFWSGLAVTGPAIAGMMQLTEARWSPSVRRLSLTTIGFLPIAFVLMIVLFAGRAVLYPWVTQPVVVKAAWLNVPFFFGGQRPILGRHRVHHGSHGHARIVAPGRSPIADIVGQARRTLWALQQKKGDDDQQHRKQ